MPLGCPLALLGADGNNRPRRVWGCSKSVGRWGSTTAIDALGKRGRLPRIAGLSQLHKGSFLTWRTPLAASLHGPGTPGVSTNRRPDIARACSTSIYSAMTSRSPAWIMRRPAPVRRRSRTRGIGAAPSDQVCRRKGRKKKSPRDLGSERASTCRPQRPHDSGDDLARGQEMVIFDVLVSGSVTWDIKGIVN